MGISEDRIYLISEVADSLGFRSKTLRKLIRSNALGGAFKVGKQWRISELMFKRRLWGEEKVPIPIITDKLLPLTVVSQFLHVEEDLRDLISASEIPLKFTEAGSQLEC